MHGMSAPADAATTLAVALARRVRTLATSKANSAVSTAGGACTIAWAMAMSVGKVASAMTCDGPRALRSKFKKARGAMPVRGQRGGGSEERAVR